MYVIRFSKINIAQVSSVTIKTILQFPLCQEERQNIDTKGSINTTLSYQINPS